MATINHADHDHPATPAARAACRKAMAGGTDPKLAVDGVRERAPKAAKGAVRLVGVAKANGTGFRSFAINDEGDLAAAVPHVFSSAIRAAWDAKWTVRSAHPYNDTEKRVEIKSDKGTLALVWKDRSPNAVWGVFWRSNTEVITHRILDAEVGIVAEGVRRLAEGV